MRTRLRWAIGLVVVLHGVIHLLGAAEGLSSSVVTPLTQPISNTMGVTWLAAAVLVVVAGVMLIRRTRWWWVVGAAAAVTSQAVVLSSWTDAKAGTIVNLVLLVAAGYGLAAQGPASLAAEYRRRVETAQGQQTRGVVTEGDLAGLPPAVAAYVRASGAVGQPRVVDVRARLHGRIRASASTPWMPFTAEQFNTYGPTTSRLFLMDATKFGLPVDVLHVFVGPSASMRVRLCSVLPVVNAAGPVMDRGETVTVFNDLCVLAPAALVDAPITWQRTDARRVRAEFTRGPHTVSAELLFNDDDELVDFVSDDRSRASADGRHFTLQRWSTPLSAYRAFGSRRVATSGEGRWHAPDPEGEFSYVEMTTDDIAYNVGKDSVRLLPADAS